MMLEWETGERLAKTSKDDKVPYSVLDTLNLDGCHKDKVVLILLGVLSYLRIRLSSRWIFPMDMFSSTSSPSPALFIRTRYSAFVILSSSSFIRI